MDRARVDAMRATLAALTTERGDEGRMYWRCVRNHFSRPGTTTTDTDTTTDADGGVVTRRVRREEMDAVARAVFGRDTEGYRTHLAFTAALRATLVAGALASAKAKERRTAEAAAAAAAAAAAMMEGEEGAGVMFRRPVAAAAPGVVAKSRGGSAAAVSVSRKKQTPTTTATTIMTTTANNTSKPRQSDRLGSTTSSGVPLGIEPSDIPSLKPVPRLRARCRMMTQTPMRVRADAAQCVRRAAAERVKRAIRAAVESRELTRSLDNSRWTSTVKVPITLEDLLDSVDVLQKLGTVGKNLHPRRSIAHHHTRAKLALS